MDAEECLIEETVGAVGVSKTPSPVGVEVVQNAASSDNSGPPAGGDINDASRESEVPTQQPDTFTFKVIAEVNHHLPLPETLVEATKTSASEQFPTEIGMAIDDSEQTLAVESAATMSTREIDMPASGASKQEPFAIVTETDDLFQSMSGPEQSDFFSQLASQHTETDEISKDVVDRGDYATVVEQSEGELCEKDEASISDEVRHTEPTLNKSLADTVEEPTISFGSATQDDAFFFTSGSSHQTEQRASQTEASAPEPNPSFDFLLDDNDFLSDDEVEDVSVQKQKAVEGTTLSYAPNSYASSLYSYVPPTPPVQPSAPPKPKAFFEDLPALSNPKIVRRIDQFIHHAVPPNEHILPPPPTDLYDKPPLATPYAALVAPRDSYDQPTVSSMSGSAPPVKKAYTPQPAAGAYAALPPSASSQTNSPQKGTFARSTASDAYDPPFMPTPFVAPRRASSAYSPQLVLQPKSPQTQFAVPRTLPPSTTYDLTNHAPTPSKYTPVAPTVFQPPRTISPNEPPVVSSFVDTDSPLVPKAISAYASPGSAAAAHPTTTSYAPHAADAYGVAQPSTASSFDSTEVYTLPPHRTTAYPPTSPPIGLPLYSDIPPTAQPKSGSVPPPVGAAVPPPMAPAGKRASLDALSSGNGYSPPPEKQPSAFSSASQPDTYSIATPNLLLQSQVASLPPQSYPMPRSVVPSPRSPKSLTPEPHPLMSWSSSGKLVTIFPSKNPNLGYAATNLDFVSSTINVHTAKDVMYGLSTDINMAKFPGPICTVGAKSANKSKKKDVLKWMGEKIQTLEQQIYESVGAEAKMMAEDNLALWKCVRIVLDNDGELDTTTTETRKAISQALTPELIGSTYSDEMATTTFTSASDIYQRHVRSTSNGSTGGPNIAEPESVIAISRVRELLLKGDRDGAVALALDNCLWAHALLIASTISKEKWKSTAREFIRADVLPLSTADACSLAAVYGVFAGCGEEAVEAFLPPGVTLSLVAANALPQQSLPQLTRWRETLTMILLNRSGDDIDAIISLGKLLASFGHTYAAHTCYIFARPHIVLGGTEYFTILGGDYARHPSSFAKNLDVIILNEIYELAISLGPNAGQNTVFPHLQLFKYQHALILAENGFVSEARKYLEQIGTAIKATAKTSFVYDAVFIQSVRELSQRLSETPAAESRWLGGMLGKPSLGNMWGNFDKKLAQFVAGDDEDPSSTGQGRDISTDGRFRKLAHSPGLSRQQSTTDVAGLYKSTQPLSGVGPSYTPPTAGSVGLYNSRSYGSSPSSARTSLYVPQNDGYGNSMETSGFYAPPVPNPYAPTREQTSSPYTPSPYAPPTDGARSSYTPPTSSYDSLATSYEPPTMSRESAKRSYEPQSSTYGPSTSAYESLEVSYEPPTTSLASPTNDHPSHAQPNSYGYEPPTKSMSMGYELTTPDMQDGEGGEQADALPANKDAFGGYAPPEQNRPSYEARGADDISAIDDDFDDEDDLGLGNNALRQRRTLVQNGPQGSDNTADDKKDEDDTEEVKEEKVPPRGWFSWLHRGGSNQEDKPKAVRAKLGEGMQFVYDKELKKWVNPNDPDAGKQPPPPPPPPKSNASIPASTASSTATSTPSPARPPASTPATPMTAPFGLPASNSAPPSSGTPPASLSASSTRGAPITGMPSLTGLPEPPAGATRRGKKRPQYIPPPTL
ncbi:Sec23-binding domain of Sec16-domain-containing protein [Lipomyces orientalis]|uniref:Sec23-binding domain of Sec16-domain-containing protein n=1 Tax=Lipomyces orientalis TaxID=1233043 RepID=A0ACC3TUR8_9ASCO